MSGPPRTLTGADTFSLMVIIGSGSGVGEGVGVRVGTLVFVAVGSGDGVAVNVGIGVGVGRVASVVAASVIFGKSTASDVAGGISANGVAVVQAARLQIPNRVKIIIIRVKFIIFLN